MPTSVKTETLSSGVTQETVIFKIGQNANDILEVKVNTSAFAGDIVVGVEDYSGMYKDPPARSVSDIAKDVVDVVGDAITDTIDAIGEWTGDQDAATTYLAPVMMIATTAMLVMQ